jgi:hypothetical protein
MAVEKPPFLLSTQIMKVMLPKTFAPVRLLRDA